MSDHGLDLDLGPSDGIGSQDFGIDIGLDIPGEEGLLSAASSSARAPSEDSMSIGVGRDAAPARGVRQSLGSHILGDMDVDMDILSHHSRAASRDPDADFGFGDFGGDMNIDLGIDLDAPPAEDVAKTPEQTHSRACAYVFCFECSLD